MPASQDAASGTDAPDAVAGAATHPDRLRLVALGDGYTEGSGIDRRDSWPSQLVQVMNRSEMQIQFVAPYNLAERGSSSDDVLDYQLPQVESYEPDVVLLQVGVNDIIIDEGLDQDQYRHNISAILDGLLAIVPADRIFVVTTPDHGLTVRGSHLGQPGADSTDVAAANRVLAEVAGERGIEVVDITRAYELVVEDPSMVIDGGPDPSARQYRGWVELIGQKLHRALSLEQP
jgi:lysophospholipase L1-like esterase